LDGYLSSWAERYNVSAIRGCPFLQASLFISTLTSAGFAAGDMAPIFDVEVTDNESNATIAARLQTAATAFPVYLGVKTFLPIILVNAG
jgi:hypothetical protein